MKSGEKQLFERSIWIPYPVKDHDEYRHLNLEKAWGQLQDKAIYLTCEIDVEETGDYLALLNDKL
ncbi:MAG: hypothetical protein HRT89_16670 [Lentisphaeria bacterium]|nr:hypothetical protein [Lentisphaeria bacterium]NQZ69694.1 hypothetical protein [Lentisphaeria bacterium]